MPDSSSYYCHDFNVIYVDEYGKKVKSSPKKTQVFRQEFGQVELDLVHIPGGKFLMGSPDSEEGRKDCEGPQHLVSVPSFWMGMYPVTQAQYRELMEEAYFGPFFARESRPADRVCWFDAVEFCRRLSEKTGHAYRLPTEAEWEYACRAGTTTPFYLGEAITPEFGDVSWGRYKSVKVHMADDKRKQWEIPEVGKFTANNFGLYDLCGGVYEWCLDEWHDNYIGAPTDGSAWLPNIPNGVDESVWYRRGWSDACRVQRSGRGYDLANHRSASRSRIMPIYPNQELCNTESGFRVVCTSLGDPPPIQSLPSLSSNKTVAGKVRQYTTASPKDVIEQLGRGVTLTMVNIPSGTFLMGSPHSESGRKDNEGPQHQVTVPEFWMSKYLVTQSQWRAVAALPQVKRKISSNPSHHKSSFFESFFNGDAYRNHPVEQVSWYDAVEFCDRLSQLTGRKYRLPSEAEWEYACRAGTTTPFHFETGLTDALANYCQPKGVYRRATTAVGQFGVANAFGLYDMHGNVLEWCEDWWHESYEGAPADGSAWLAHEDDVKEHRVLRGGCWLYFPEYCRSAYRGWNAPGGIFSSGGFRVVCGGART